MAFLKEQKLQAYAITTVSQGPIFFRGAAYSVVNLNAQITTSLLTYLNRISLCFGHRQIYIKSIKILKYIHKYNFVYLPKNRIFQL